MKKTNKNNNHKFLSKNYIKGAISGALALTILCSGVGVAAYSAGADNTHRLSVFRQKVRLRLLRRQAQLKRLSKSSAKMKPFMLLLTQTVRLRKSL